MAIEPTVKEARVLQALLARRRKSKEPMSVALAEAWKTAGKPDLSAGLLPALAAGAPRSRLRGLEQTWEGALRGLPRREAFLFWPVMLQLANGGGLNTGAGKAHLKAYDEWRKRQESEAEELAKDPGANSVALNLALLKWLREDARALRRVLDTLVRTLPEDGVVALAHLLEGTSNDAPLTMAEVDAIAAAARKRSWHETERVMYVELKDIARRVDQSRAELLATHAFVWMGPTTGALFTLSKRAAATVEPQLRARLAVSLEATGKGLAPGGTMA